MFALPRLRSYRAKLQAAFVGLAALAIAVTLWEAGFGSSAALRAATLDRLTAIRQTRSRQIERYFEDVASHVLALAADESTVAALEGFTRAWPQLASPGETESKLAAHYKSNLDWLPADPRGRALQYHYIAAPSPPPGLYDGVHTRYHPTFHRYQSAFGFYDIFLIDPAGRILYTVRKEIDLGADLARNPYAGTSLAKAFRRALTRTSAGPSVLQDYETYIPSHAAPAAFAATAVRRGGQTIGVLAIQISIDEVNRVIAGDGHWREEGLGETGQAYLVDFQNRLRSGVRFQRPPGEPLTGSGTAISADGQRLRSWAPLSVRDVDWLLVAEIDASEALAPISVLQMRIAGFGLLIAGAFFFIARWLAKGVTAPVLALAENARRLGSHDFDARLEITRDDEIGELAASFNRMAADLQQTTVSKTAVDRILDSMLNAVFVTGNGRIARANPAAEKLLGYDPGGLTGGRVPAVLAPSAGPAIETELIRRDGSTVPVLLTVARLEGEDAVYAAQDITEIRRLAGQLIAAQEDERRRIARELHDDFSQRLAAVAIAAGRQDNVPLRQQIAELAKELHALSRRLHPAMLDDLGLEAAIAAECRASFERGGPPVDFVVEGEIPRGSPDTNLTLYRILQEALRNIARHADAQQITVRLRPNEIEIGDDGQGFDPNRIRAGAGLGLASMQERVRLHGGRWSLVSVPGQGTTIVASLNA